MRQKHKKNNTRLTDHVRHNEAATDLRNRTPNKNETTSEAKFGS